MLATAREAGDTCHTAVTRRLLSFLSGYEPEGTSLVAANWITATQFCLLKALAYPGIGAVTFSAEFLAR